MLMSSFTGTAMVIGWKFMLTKYANTNNQISPAEMTYWQAIMLLVIVMLTMKYLGEDFFPVPKAARIPLIVRGVAGFGGNMCYLIAL